MTDPDDLALLAAMIAHDAQNVLAAMTLAADALIAHADERAAHAQVLAEGCRRISAMLRRLRAPRGGGEPEVLDVDHAIVAIAPTLRALLGDRARLGLRLDGALPSIAIDAAELDSVVGRGTRVRIWLPTAS